GSGYNGLFSQAADGIRRLYVTEVQTSAPPIVTKYVDGINQDDWTANQGLDNPRRALLPTAVLFGDGDQDERRTFWVNSIQIRERSEERRVGKECRCRWWPGHSEKSRASAGAGR